MIGVLVSAATNLVTTWLNGRQKKQEAKDEREIKALTNEANWDEVQAEGSKSSWKDEYWTIIFSIPLVLCFIPSMVEYVEAGFRALQIVPEWYRYCVMSLVAASVGIKKLSQLKWR